jgi:hypothetical protein
MYSFISYTFCKKKSVIALKTASLSQEIIFICGVDTKELLKDNVGGLLTG